jgi:hypothetical protein
MRYEEVKQGVFGNTKYKPVDRKVTPIPGTLPEEFKVVRRFPEDPLLTLPAVPKLPPEFSPGTRLNEERWEKIKSQLEEIGFLWPEEIKLVGYILRQNEMGIAWDDTEKGQFRTDYFPPIKFPIVAHVPWVHKNIRIPPGLKDRLIEELQRKINMGILEPTNSSYRSRWFVVPKKDGNPRIVWNLEPLNAITIRDAAVPPIIDEVIEEFAGYSVYSLGDLYIGYDHQPIHPDSRDLTTVQTPLGPYRLTTLPMGWTNSVTIFHQNVMFILQDEVPHVARPFIDDVPMKGPKSDYRNEDGTYQTIEGNPNIRRFIFEHLVDFNRVLHRIKHAGGTFSAKKFSICVPEFSILGHKCSAVGRLPDDSHVRKILEWPACKNFTEVKGFLGVTGLVRIFIRNYAEIAAPLTYLTRKSVEFAWNIEQEEAMAALKQAATTAPALKPINYSSGHLVILAVDSSRFACGYVLMQMDEDNRRHPARYGSITWNEVESKYSQAKLELYGLMRALRAVRMFIVGLQKIRVEVDAAYIKGMLNNPDEVPNATLNRWLAYIQLFDFELKHVPANRHKAPDGLSRKPFVEGSDEPEDQRTVEEEIDEKLEIFARESGPIPSIRSILYPTPRGLMEFPNLPRSQVHSTFQMVEQDLSEEEVEGKNLPITVKMKERDLDLAIINSYLKTLTIDDSVTPAQRRRITKHTSKYFVNGDVMYRRQPNLRHQVVVPYSKRLSIMRQLHDDLGHKGYFSTRKLLLDRFWWPNCTADLKWYLKTCHQCQTSNMFKLRIPPTVQEPAPLFSKVYCDTMYMEKHGGFRYILHARCSLCAWPEYRVIKKESARIIGEFIFTELLCRWGALREIVTDNGAPWVKAVQYLSHKYKINHIRISPYNSQAQGPIERQHLTIRESIVKSCKGDLKKWPEMTPYAFWADRITTRKSTGHSPYFMAHGVEPIMPFDIVEATYLVPQLNRPMNTTELIALRAIQLRKRDTDIEQMKKRVWTARKQSAEEFTRKFEKNIREYDLPPGKLVLVRNSRVEMDLGRKWKPRYLGPYVVVSRSSRGTYKLAELDGTLSALEFAQRRVIPYYWRETEPLPVPDGSIDEVNKEISQPPDRTEANEPE